MTDLPAGLLRYLSNRFALIDLRANRLRTLNADVLQYQASASSPAGSNSKRANTISAAVNSPKAWSSFQVAGKPHTSHQVS